MDVTPSLGCGIAAPIAAPFWSLDFLTHLWPLRRAVSDDFNERRKEWQLYVRQQKEIKHKEYLAFKAQRQAEFEAQKKAYEEEEAKRDPWEEEKVICEQLISWVEKHMPKKEEAKAEAKQIEHPAGAKPLVKKALDEDDPFASLGKKKSKRKGGGAAEAGTAAPAKPKVIKLTHAPDDLTLWEKLGFKAPNDTSECPTLLEKLIAKREVRARPSPSLPYASIRITARIHSARQLACCTSRADMRTRRFVAAPDAVIRRSG